MIVQVEATISTGTTDSLSHARALNAWARGLKSMPSKTRALEQAQIVLSAIRRGDRKIADALIEQLAMLGPKDLNGVKRWARSAARVAATAYFVAYPQQVPLHQFCGLARCRKRKTEEQMQAILLGNEQTLRCRLAQGKNILFCGQDVRYDPIADTFVARWVANLAAENESERLITEEAPARVVISVLVWNGWEDIEVLMPSLAKIDTPNVELVILDNASDEPLLNRLSNWYQDNQPPFVLTLMRSEENLGFDEGNNVIVDYALHGKGLADYVYFLNDDTRVAPDFLSQSLGVIRSMEGIGAVGSKVFFWGNAPFAADTSGDSVQFAGRRLWLSPNSEISSTDEFTAETEWPHGAGFLVSRQVIERAGAWDPRFFAYMEELDLALRMQNAGSKTVVALKSKIWHKAPAEFYSPSSIRLNVRNIFLLSRKHDQARSISGLYRILGSIQWFIFTSWRHVRSERRLAYLWAPFLGIVEGVLGRFSDVQYGKIDETFTSRREPFPAMTDHQR